MKRITADKEEQFIVQKISW